MTFTTPRSLLAGLLLAATIGCVDPEGGGSTSNTALYAFDGAAADGSPRLFAWDDLSALYGLPTTAPTRSLSGSDLDKVKHLAWNGMVLDRTYAKLYLVSQDGTVVRINDIRKKSGHLSADVDIVAFTIGDPDRSDDRLAGGRFGQAALDPSGQTLFVCESNSSSARIWVVQNPAQFGKDAKTPSSHIKVTGDKAPNQSMGVCFGDNILYASIESGSSYTPLGTSDTYDGYRIRRGTASGFTEPVLPNQVIFSAAAPLDLRGHGALAYDSGNNRIYFARHLGGTSTTDSPILMYRTGDFGTSGLKPTPTPLGPSTITQLRVLAHPGNKDWLAGALSEADSPTNRMVIWKNPGGGTDPVTVVYGTSAIRGLAMDGNN